ncbi:hypothetical protein [Erythrobacter tepidarius]|uniref:hypothetical protein n=1 Tax=Erythrobacter tepidarius TaxID=60454 RepID=UPI00117CAB94|nr:hypothetical protein [Erythrobacter tepidarius]
MLLALFFAVLIALRLLNVEDSLRNALRAALRAEDSYQERREIQGPIIATIVLLAGAGTLALHYRTMRYVRGRRNVARMAALWGAMAMLCLIGLRIISLHSVDALLYGAAKLNWIIDIGASLTVLGAAIYYTWLVRRQG